ncbi:MAG: hypothetical protein ACREGI_02295, partial [Candidatus Levyibacteriota bacterium]
MKTFSSDQDPYSITSVIVNKTIEQIQRNNPIRIAFLDIDFTLSSRVESIPLLLKKLEELGFIVAFVTSRTEEMLMDEKSYQKSVTYGFSRPEYHGKRQSEKYVYADPKELYPYFINPDIIIASTGTEIYINQENGSYLHDLSFGKRENDWRKNICVMLDTIDQSLFSFSPIEDEENYHAGIADVFPPQFRIQVQFVSQDSMDKFLYELAKKITYESFSHVLKGTLPKIRIIDDSDRDKKQFSLFITPVDMHKGSGVDHVLTKLTEKLRSLSKRKKYNFSHMEILIAGDSPADYSMLFESAHGAKTTGLIVGGSRLHWLFDKTNKNKTLTDLQKRLHKTLRKGWYQYRSSLKEKRGVFFGDERYPSTIGPETILQYLEAIRRADKR